MIAEEKKLTNGSGHFYLEINSLCSKDLHVLDYDIKMMQGSFFSRPVSLAALIPWWEQWVLEFRVSGCWVYNTEGAQTVAK